MKKYDKISTYFKENWYIVLPMIICAFFFDGLMCFIPIIEGKTIDSLKTQNFDKVLSWSMIFIFLVLFIQFNRFWKRFLVRVFGNKMSLKMREICLGNLLDEKIEYFSKNTAGDILNRNVSDIYDTTEGIRKMTTEFFDTIVLLVGYLISMFIMDIIVTLYVFIFIFLSIFFAQIMKRYVYKTTKEYKEYLSVNKEMTISNLNNEINYRGFGVREKYNEKYNKSVDTLRKKEYKELIFKSSLEPLYSAIANIGVIFIIVIMGMGVIDGKYEIGTLVAYLTTFFLVARKTGRIGKVFNAYQGFKVSWKRCKMFLQKNELKKFDFDIKSNDLVLKNFSFQYENGFRIPTIDLKATKGEIIGICGLVHTGKTTILKALNGLYDYEGEAFLSGVSLDKLKYDDKEYISYCSSDVALFSDTAENNIILGRTGDFDKAVSVSKLDIEEIGGLKSVLSHSYTNISGGQQKRLQMARALYPNCPLILLDDPFQSVNMELAMEMIKSLKEYKNEIIILVSNNPMILKETSQIVFLNDEKAIIDSYDSLIKKEDFSQLLGVK